MIVEREETWRAVEEILLVLARERGAETARLLRPILRTNLDRGRVEGFTAGRLDRVRDYVNRVADSFVQHRAYLHAVQLEKTSVVWEPLYEKLQLWAYNFLVRKGQPRDPETEDVALECATDAALSVIDSHFPYDVPFDAWAHVLVHNACRKKYRQERLKSVIPQEVLVDLHDALEEVADPAGVGTSPPSGLAGLLPEAIGRLTGARRRVIEAIYFEGLRPAEIAGELGRSVGAVHSLRFNALEDLRKIVNRIRNSINE